MNNCSTPLFVALLLIGQSAVALPPEGTDWVPLDAMSDEFESDSLNGNKWFDRNPSWRGRKPVFFHPDCVKVGQGNLIISAFDAVNSGRRNLPDGFTNVSGFVKSKALVRFGYFEIRAKLMPSDLVSCFWLSRHTPEEWSEIDCVEVPAGISKHQDQLYSNLHYFYGPHYRGTKKKHVVDPSAITMPFNLADDFHTYGVEWNSTHIRWYVDEKLVRESANALFYQPLQMNINVEANEYFGALPDDKHLPSSYTIDWVRSWRPKNELQSWKEKTKTKLLGN